MGPDAVLRDAAPAAPASRSCATRWASACSSVGIGAGEVVDLSGVGARVVELAVAVGVLHVEVAQRADGVVVGDRLVRARARARRAVAEMSVRAWPGSRRSGSALVGVGWLQRERPPTAVARHRRSESVASGARRGRRCASGARRARRREPAPSNERPSVNDGARHPGHRLERRREVDVAGELRDVRPGGDARAADQQRHVDVGVVRRLLPRRQPVLAEVEAVVRREHDVGVVELPGRCAACAPACATPRSTACSDRMRRR